MLDDKEIDGHFYQVNKLNPFKQFNIARKLAPIFVEAGPVLLAAIREGQGIMAADPLVLFAPMCNALAEMKDEDGEALLKLCLSAIRRRTDTGGYSPLIAPSGGFMYEDIQLPTIMKLVWEVVQVNLLSFIPINQQAFQSPPPAA